MEELKQCEELFYGKNDIEQSYRLIKPLFDQDKNNEEIFSLYLSILYYHDKFEALDLAEKNKDKLISNLILIDNYTKGDFLSAEEVLLEAEKKWENNLLLQCRKIVLLYSVYQSTKSRTLLSEINKVVKTLPEATNKVERTWKEKVIEIKQGNCDSVFYTRDFCDDKDIYYELFIRDFAMSKDELVVDKEGSGDFKTISKALAVAKEDAVIRIIDGSYNETIEINRNVTLKGEGETQPDIFNNKGTVCIVNADATISNVRISNHNLTNRDEETFSMVLLNANTSFSDCEIIGSVDSNIEVTNGKASFDNCIISNAKGYGIICDESSSLQCVNSKLSENEKTAVKGNYASISLKETELFENGNAFVVDDVKGSLDNIKVHNNYGYGLIANGTTEIKLNNCVISSCKEGGVTSSDTSNLTFENCEILSNKGNGISLNDEAFVNVNNSKIIENLGNGIVFEKNANAKIDNTEIANSKEENILVCNTANVSISNSSIHSGYCKGIRFTDECKASLFNCDIYENKEENIYIEENANPSIKECDIYDGQDYGVKIKGNSNSAFENCSIYNNESINFLELESAETNIKNCKVYFLEKYSGVNIYTDDDASAEIVDCVIDGGHTGVKVRLESYIDMYHCKIKNTGFNCIHVLKGAESDITECEISNSQGYGIHISEDGQPFITECDIHDTEEAIYLERECAGCYMFNKIHNNVHGIHLEQCVEESPTGRFISNELYDNENLDFLNIISCYGKQSTFEGNFSSQAYNIKDSEGYKTLLGCYPQTLKKASVKIDESKTYKVQGWECYKGDGEYYVKAVSNNNEDDYLDKFSDGTQAEKGQTYYFKLEPIEWMNIVGDKYLSLRILDAIQFDKHFDPDEYDDPPRMVDGKLIHSNNYKYSQFRAYLNGLDGSSYDVENFVGKGFIDKAFTDIGKQYLLDNEVINESLYDSEDPEAIEKYASGNTTDKVYILGQEEMNNKNYRMKFKDFYRPIKLTDYAIAMGAHGITGQDKNGKPITLGTYALRTEQAFGSETTSIWYDDQKIHGLETINTVGFAPVISIGKHY